MTDHILICPFNEQLLARLRQRTLVIKTDDISSINHITREVNRLNYLHAINIRTDVPVSAIPFRDDWQQSPLAIYTNAFGNYQEFMQQLNLIRKLNVRIFLAPDNESNYTGLRIMSSLGVACGLYIYDGSFNWNLLNDLMYYAMYGKARHAPIEPFTWIASNYDPAGYCDFSSVYFNYPGRYLHMNEHEQIALTEKDMLQGNFICEGIMSLETIHENKKYCDALSARYETMLKMNECAFCPAFRICMAKFEHLADKENTCKTFFTDLMDAADYAYSRRNNRETRLWQL